MACVCKRSRSSKELFCSHRNFRVAREGEALLSLAKTSVLIITSLVTQATAIETIIYVEPSSK